MSKCQNAGVSGPKGEENAEVREGKTSFAKKKERELDAGVFHSGEEFSFLGRVIVPCWEGRIYVWYCIKGNEKGVYKNELKRESYNNSTSQKERTPRTREKIPGRGQDKKKIRVK